jgi:serralysin
LQAAFRHPKSLESNILQTQPKRSQKKPFFTIYQEIIMASIRRSLNTLVGDPLLAEDAENAVVRTLDILEEAGLIEPATGRTFNGSRRTDIYIGNNRNNQVNTRGGDDIVLGGGGNDFLRLGGGDDLAFGGDGNDTILGGPGNDIVFGNAGDDFLNGGVGNDWLSGGDGADILLGQGGNDTLVGGNGVDTMTGGAGSDTFVYLGNPFATNAPDVITDYEIGVDRFALKGQDLGIAALAFQQGNAANIAADGNVIVLLNSFPNAGAAAQAIADNPNITSRRGVFVYHNLNLGISRLVHSSNLAEDGDFTVLANLINQAGQIGINNLANFSANDFSLV